MGLDVDRMQPNKRGVTEPIAAQATKSPNPHLQPHRAARRVMVTLAVLAATQLTACSKTVVWEEEVPLNTGEVIWVKRTVEYSYQGGGGNPLDMAYRPDWPELTEFTWDGKKYAYKGNARILLLAIAPQKQPVLVARAADRSWGWVHGYLCTTPYYVQLMPDTIGKNWTWPPEIQQWLYGLPANLLLSRYTPEKMRERYSAKQRQTEDGLGSTQDPSQASIQLDHIGDIGSCKSKETKK